MTGITPATDNNRTTKYDRIHIKNTQISTGENLFRVEKLQEYINGEKNNIQVYVTEKYSLLVP
jgi:hypothetical protein